MTKHKCEICLGAFPKYVVANDICQFCLNRKELYKELVLERECRLKLEDKIELLEAKVNSLSDSNKFEKIISDKKIQELNEFKLVSNKKKNIKKYMPKHFSIETRNSFESLNNNEDLECIVIGDSQIRNLGLEINRKNPSKKKKKTTAYCYPGATTKFVKNRINDLKPINTATEMILHVGGNDVRIENKKFASTEELLTKYKIMLEKAKEKSNKLTVISILPRHNETYEWTSRSIGLNSRIEKMCNHLKIDFLDLWKDFYDTTLYNSKGIHLNAKGSEKLADILLKNCYNNQGN